MTLEEKVLLLSGSDVWRTAPVERLDIPAIKVSDGPNGVRGDSTTGARAVCLPASISLGASFDVDLVTELGRLLGRETARKGAHVLLAPTINIARHPIGGRNFESFGEEPLLTAAMAVAYIEGVQDEGVGACAKHFVANDVEQARLTVSSQVDAETLREVYLVPFEAAVDADVWTLMSAYPKLNGVHCSENRWLLTDLLRQEWGFGGLVMSDWGATHHPARSIEAGLDLEMPGPPLALGPNLLAVMERGELPADALDERAVTVVDLAVRSGRLGMTEEPERSVDLPEERALVRRAAADGMVLLANHQVGDRPALPFETSLASLAVIGPNADPGVIQGGGSAQLPAHHITSPVAGLREALPDAQVELQPGCLADRYLPQPDPSAWASVTAPDGGTGPFVVEVFDAAVPTGTPAAARSTKSVYALLHDHNPAVPDSGHVWSQRWTGRLPVTADGQHRFSVLAVGLSRVLVDGEVVVDNWSAPQPGEAFFEKASSELIGTVELQAGSEVEVVVEWSADRPSDLWGLRFGYQPPTDEDAMLDAAVAAAAGADAAVVVVGLNAEWETEGHDRPMFGLPGRQDELVARVVAANPRTAVVINAGGPVDLPWLDEVPAAIMAWYPGQEFGGALADVLFGHQDPGGRLPVSFPRSMDKTPTTSLVPGDGLTLAYDEGLFVGHRWYHQQQVEPRLPFGHGLSYASFELGQPVVTTTDDAGPGTGARPAGTGGHAVTMSVTNTGDRAGKCVVQLYLQPALAGRPRVLAGVGVARLSPGEVGQVAIGVDPLALRRWDEAAQGWEALTGTHRLDIALSAGQTVHTESLTVT